MITEVTLESLQQHYFNGQFKVLKISTGFPIDKFKEIIDRYILKYGTLKKDGYSNYKGIALQYYHEENPFFDSLQSSEYIKAEKVIYFKKNALALELDEIYKKLSPIRLSRGRVIIAEPGFKMSEHTDGHHIHTLHIPLTSDPECVLIIEGESFYLPADGSTYLVNATKPHYVVNESRVDRMHVTFPIGPPSFHSWKKSEIQSLHRYFEMMGVTPNDFGLEVRED